MGAGFSVLAGICGIYMFLIFIRIFLTWFAGANFGRAYDILCRISDPYLDWFRRFRLFRNSALDFSPVIGLVTLSLVQNVFTFLSKWGRISLGIILAMALSALWSIASLILGFAVIILILRLIAYLGRFNIYSPFWNLVDRISQPLLYRISRIFFPRRLMNYLFRIIFSIVLLTALYLAAGRLVGLGSELLSALPI
ncbi:membrane protein [Spirochaetia bacterium]|nr:membrane protein [Spirochaetia bacterium]